jgi:radical SAM superfamily enzyme YgiQ (UPF0313 family)
MNKKGKAVLIGAEDEENLAIRYLAAVLENNGHHIKIIPCTRYQDFSKIRKEVKKWNPDMMVVSMAFQSMTAMFLTVIQEIKEIKPEIHVTVGGHFPTFEYMKLLENKYIDSVIRFEGENPLTQLMDGLMNGKDLSKIPNLLYKDKEGKVVENILKPEFPDMDNLTFPIRNKNPQYRLGERFATLITSRGCFHSKCLYCCIGAFHYPKNGPKYALRNPENIVLEMSHLYHNGGVKLFQFHDDNFLLPNQKKSLERIKSIKKGLIKKKVDMDSIAVLIKTRPDSLDEELMSSLVDMGTVGIFLGVENASKSGLKALKRGSNIDHIYDSIELIEQYPISMTFNLLIFHPTANLDEINQNIYFMSKYLDKAFDFGRAEIVAGSPLEKLVIKKGLLRGNWPQWDYIIEDSAVEKMFRINSLTFYRENSPYPNISHQLIALSYRAQLLERFYPGLKSSHLSKESKDLIRKSNEFTLEKLLRVYQITAETELKYSIYEIYSEMQDFYGNINGMIGNLSDEMLRFQLVEQSFKDQGLDGYLQNSKILGKIFRI